MSVHRTSIKIKKVGYPRLLPLTVCVIPECRFVPAIRQHEHISAAHPILGSFIGGARLKPYHLRHQTLYITLSSSLLIFILGVGISAIFTVDEVCPSAELRSNSHVTFSSSYYLVHAYSDPLHWQNTVLPLRTP